jgi:hypothetical protein
MNSDERKAGGRFLAAERGAFSSLPDEPQPISEEVTKPLVLDFREKQSVTHAATSPISETAKMDEKTRKMLESLLGH